MWRGRTSRLPSSVFLLIEWAKLCAMSPARIGAWHRFHSSRARRGEPEQMAKMRRSNG